MNYWFHILFWPFLIWDIIAPIIIFRRACKNYNKFNCNENNIGQKENFSSSPSDHSFEEVKQEKYNGSKNKRNSNKDDTNTPYFVVSIGIFLPQYLITEKKEITQNYKTK